MEEKEQGTLVTDYPSEQHSPDLMFDFDISEGLAKQLETSLSKRVFEESFLVISKSMQDFALNPKMNMNYPILPPNFEQKPPSKQSTNPLFMLKRDKLMTKLFDAHFVNTKLQLKNSKFSLLNKETIFTVVLELSPDNPIRFEMRYTNFEAFYDRVAKMTLVRPAFPFGIKEKLMRSEAELELLLKVFFQKIMCSPDPKLVNETCFFIYSMMGNIEMIQRYQSDFKQIKQTGVLKKGMNVVYHSILSFVKNTIGKELNEFEMFQKSTANKLKDLKIFYKKIGGMIASQEQLKRDIKKYSGVIDHVAVDLMLENNKKYQDMTVSDLEMDNNCKALKYVGINIESSSMKEAKIALETFIWDLELLTSNICSLKLFEENKTSITLFVRWYKPLFNNLKTYCLGLVNGFK